MQLVQMQFKLDDEQVLYIIQLLVEVGVDISQVAILTIAEVDEERFCVAVIGQIALYLLQYELDEQVLAHELIDEIHKQTTLQLIEVIDDYSVIDEHLEADALEAVGCLMVLVDDEGRVEMELVVHLTADEIDDHDFIDMVDDEEVVDTSVLEHDAMVEEVIIVMQIIFDEVDEVVRIDVKGWWKYVTPQTEVSELSQQLEEIVAILVIDIVCIDSPQIEHLQQ